LTFSKDNPNPDEVIKWFFYSCNELFYSNIYKLDKLLGDNDVIIDGGGNIGLFSLYAKNLRENIPCLIFEPEIHNFKALEKNLKNYENIKLFNKGLADAVKEGDLLLSDNVIGHRLNSKLIDFDLQTKYYDSQKIKLNVDNVAFSTKIKKIDLVKLGIEGSELLALEEGG
jgi:FkbM family methyltransferase